MERACILICGGQRPEAISARPVGLKKGSFFVFVLRTSLAPWWILASLMSYSEKSQVSPALISSDLRPEESKGFLKLVEMDDWDFITSHWEAVKIRRDSLQRRTSHQAIGP